MDLKIKSPSNFNWKNCSQIWGTKSHTLTTNRQPSASAATAKPVFVCLRIVWTMWSWRESVDWGELSKNILICETCELNRNDLFDAKLAQRAVVRNVFGNWPVRVSFFSSLIFYGFRVHAKSTWGPIENGFVTMRSCQRRRARVTDDRNGHFKAFSESACRIEIESSERFIGSPQSDIRMDVAVQTSRIFVTHADTNRYTHTLHMQSQSE